MLCLAALPVAASRCEYDDISTSSTEVMFSLWFVCSFVSPSGGQQDYLKVMDGFCEFFFNRLTVFFENVLKTRRPANRNKRK